MSEDQTAIDYRKEYALELKRTQMGYSKLSGCFSERGQPKYSAAFLRKLNEGQNADIDENIWQEIIGFLKQLPNVQVTPKELYTKRKSANSGIAITDEMRDALNHEFERTGIVVTTLLRIFILSSLIVMYQFLLESRAQVDACSVPDADGYDCTV
jgi:hypothetical protein